MFRVKVLTDRCDLIYKGTSFFSLTSNFNQIIAMIKGCSFSLRGSSQNSSRDMPLARLSGQGSSLNDSLLAHFSFLPIPRLSVKLLANLAAISNADVPRISRFRDYLLLISNEKKKLTLRLPAETRNVI